VWCFWCGCEGHDCTCVLLTLWLFGCLALHWDGRSGLLVVSKDIGAFRGKELIVAGNPSSLLMDLGGWKWLADDGCVFFLYCCNILRAVTHWARR